MTMRIEREPRGFRIGIGDHRVHKATSIQEVVYALEHYYREPVPGYSNAKGDFWQNHVDHAKQCSCCPLCRNGADL